MKTVFRRFITIFLALAAASFLTVPVFAVYCDKNQTVYFQNIRSSSAQTDSTQAEIVISDYADFTLNAKSITVDPGNTSARLCSLVKCNRMDALQWYKYVAGKWGDPSISGEVYYILTLNHIRRPGTFKVSFTADGEAINAKVKVLDYINPVQTMTVKNSNGTGLNKGKNLAAKTNKFSLVSYSKLPFDKATIKGAKLRITAITGWKITNVLFSNAKHEYHYTPTSGVKSVNLLLGTLSRADDNNIYVTFKNNKNGGTISTRYFFGQADWGDD